MTPTPESVEKINALATTAGSQQLSARSSGHTFQNTDHDCRCKVLDRGNEVVVIIDTYSPYRPVVAIVLSSKATETPPLPLLSIARLGDKLREFLHADRLGEILVNASVESIRPGLFTSDACQSADIGRSEAVATFVFADLGSRFEAVHNGHILGGRREKRSARYFREKNRLLCCFDLPCPLRSGRTCPDFS